MNWKILVLLMFLMTFALDIVLVAMVTNVEKLFWAFKTLFDGTASILLIISIIIGNGEST